MTQTQESDPQRGSVRLTLHIQNPGADDQCFTSLVQISDRVQINFGMEDALMREIWDMFYDQLNYAMQHAKV